MTARLTTAEKSARAATRKAAAKATPIKRSAKAAKPVIGSTKLDSDSADVPTDLVMLRKLIKITRDRRWRASRRDDAQLVSQMTKRLAQLTAAASSMTS